MFGTDGFVAFCMDTVHNIKGRLSNTFNRRTFNNLQPKLRIISGHGYKTKIGKQLLVRAPILVVIRKGYGFPQGDRWLGALCLYPLPVNKD